MGFFRFLFIIVLSASALFGGLRDKSAIVYYGKDISYPMVGIHDYIIVQPDNINTNTHGFSLYKDKMYAYVSIWEIDNTIKQYKHVKKDWIIAKNKSWNSEVLDLKNKNYVEFIFKHLIEPRLRKGFKNFFFDTLDSYQLASKTKEEREVNKQALVSFINEFHKKYPSCKLIINRGFEIIDDIHESIEAVLFESYYAGVGGEKLAYKPVDEKDREWLDKYIEKIKSYNIPVISVEYLPVNQMVKAKALSEMILKKGMIPYISNRELDIYGISSKNALKREVFTLIDERRLDRTLLEAHQHGGLVLEYMGYIQKLYDINKGLPDVDKMGHYAGVIIWLQDYYKEPQKLVSWVKRLQQAGIKVLFAGNFGATPTTKLLSPLGITVTRVAKEKERISYQDEMIGYEINPSLLTSYEQFDINDSKPLLIYEYRDGTRSVPAAITPWGGYAVAEAFMVNINEDNIWVVNPFKLFKEALNLQELIVPDPTTQNGKRLLFTHIDGDGIMNRVEGNYEKFSGEVILEEILKKYKIPHSVSVIGAEIDEHGLYPDIALKLQQIAKEMYALENVEPATHTFTHPFFWNKIKNDDLSPQYRLKPKGYKFSLDREIRGSLEDIQTKLLPKGSKKKAQTVFWSGDCAPTELVLDNVYKNHILNINGGDTIITKIKPWLAGVAPFGLKRGEYYQIYTGAQNENVFTNDWLGPFWGFKRVVQTFQMTDSPRRFKPIDVYYHLYSGSKMASMRALKYVFDWAVKQDVMPIYTSEYIPKVMDFYDASIANVAQSWIVCGMRDLKTVRVESKDIDIDIEGSKSVIGIKTYENHTYISLDNHVEHLIRLNSINDKSKSSYLVSSNGKLVSFESGKKSKKYSFSSYVDLKADFHIADGCSVSTYPRALKSKKSQNGIVAFEYKGVKNATFEIRCN